MKSIGPFELILIFGILLLIFGASRLAGIGKAMGTSIKEFRKGVKDSAESESAPQTPAKTSTDSKQH